MSCHRNLTAAMAVLLLASPLAAQTASRDTSAASVTPTATPVIPRSAHDSLVSLSPTWEPAWTVAAGAHANTRMTPVRRFLDPESSQSAALMIVGGVGLLVGTVVSGKPGTIIMVSGAVIGLIGLWRYAR